MSNGKFTNETVYRRFLFGEMTEEEREKFEAEFFADADIFDEICVAEDELVESYIRGTLDFETKRRFETHYLKTKKGAEKLAFTRSMLEELQTAKNEVETEEKTSVWKSLIAFFTTPKLAFGAGFVLLLIAFTSWFLLKETNESEVAATITPTPTVKTVTNLNVSTNQNSAVAIPVNNSNKEIANTNSEPKPIPKATETPKEKTFVPNPVLALFAGTVRGNGKMNSVTIPNEAKGLSLQLNLESRDYKSYRAGLVDQDGKLIFKSGKITAQGARLNTFIPSAKLKKGDYIVKVYGINAENAEESAADFQFRVNR
ncbi:MAG: hypothetical protein LUM44_00290 [Pyrinomonadaceae bacterium]|nr:hypothetical protein [Pyrinomonadaceae bacterium]